MYDVVTFGEAMIRLSSPEYRRLENATKLDVEIGGGEYNVAVGCAHLGLKAAWVSRLVDNWTGVDHSQQGSRARGGYVPYLVDGF